MTPWEMIFVFGRGRISQYIDMGYLLLSKYTAH